MKIKIISDAFNIAKRIKKIDKNYLIKFNTKNKKFEIYYKQGLNEKLELTLPFKNLDYRVLNKVLETKIENLKILIKQMDENNKRLEKQELNNDLDYAHDILKYCVKKI